jgi:hypothetical protein
MIVTRAWAMLRDHSTSLLRRTGLVTSAWLLIGSAAILPITPVRAVPWEFDGVSRIIAISDVHGAHQAFVETLQAAGVVDAATAWTGGRTHLVIVGDILDRGDESRRSMDLLMRLEREAAAAGGLVHVVLGNHELMNLVGDLRYVAKGEFAAFAVEESPAMRDAAYARHVRDPARPGAPLTREEFDARFPPGFFAHRAAFSAAGAYGRWLLQKPLVLRINDTLFVHAGLGTALAAMSLPEINGRLRGELIEYVELLTRLASEGQLDPTTDFHAIPALAAAGADPLLQRLLELHGSMIHAPASPLWYRGNAGCGPLIEQDRLAAILLALGSRRAVIGHTPTFRRRVWRRLDDRILLIDAGMLHSHYSGQGAALLLEQSGLSVFYQGAGRAVAVEELEPRSGVLSADLAPEELEAILASGEITGRSSAPAGELLTLRAHGIEVQALFTPASGGRGRFPQVAAYRLDRLLNLAMVPAAVIRPLDGRPGTVQHLPQGLITEAERIAGKVRIDAWCPLQDQVQLMQLFDALIGNRTRTATDVQHSLSSGAVILTGHDTAFGTDTAIPEHLAIAGLEPGALWRRRLDSLASGPAREQLLEVLTRRQYEALLARARTIGDVSLSLESPRYTGERRGQP